MKIYSRAAIEVMQVLNKNNRPTTAVEITKILNKKNCTIQKMLSILHHRGLAKQVFIGEYILTEQGKEIFKNET